MSDSRANVSAKRSGGTRPLRDGRERVYFLAGAAALADSAGSTCLTT